MKSALKFKIGQIVTYKHDDDFGNHWGMSGKIFQVIDQHSDYVYIKRYSNRINEDYSYPDIFCVSPSNLDILSLREICNS